MRPSADRRARRMPGVDLPGERGRAGHDDQEGLDAMKVGIPKEVKNHEYRVAMHAGRRARAGPFRA